MIQCLFLPNDCNDGSERLQPAVGSVSRVLEGVFLMLYGLTGKKDLAVISERVLIRYLVNVVKERSCDAINMCQGTF